MFRRSLVTLLCLFFGSACGSPENRLSSAENEALSISDSGSQLLERSFDKHELAARFAPIIHMHPQELYIPMDPESYLNRPENERDENFFLSSRADYFNGQQARTIVNVSEDGQHIQYWIFYPKNGCQGAKIRYRVQGPIKIGDLGETVRTLELCNIAIHEGDWENITLKLTDDKSRVESAYLSAHGHGNWLPASALEFQGERPYLYSALNSHAYYAKDIGFHAETTIAHLALDGMLGIDWFQVGDIISDQAYIQKNPADGPRVIEFDTQRALLHYTDITNASLRSFDGLWGKTVNAKDVLTLPELSFGPIEAVVKFALNIALNMVPELKDKSNGESPPSPWVRAEWRGFDNQYTIASGLTFDHPFGGDGGQAFVDYEKLIKQLTFHVREITIRSGDRVDRVCLRLDETGDLCHGGNGGKEKKLVLESGEYVKSIGTALGTKSGNKRIFAIKFTTNFGRTLEGGSWTNETTWQYAPEGMQLVGWYGASGDEVDSLGSIYGTLPQ